ncbi:ATP-binding cassette [Lithospermum erythrorhizon]|uniref:ATP-binding cassette n=1 Tax=Lithospermum erythrorhizon TaxID=34254 RepID=A0AAV3Q407_LITER
MPYVIKMKNLEDGSRIQLFSASNSPEESHSTISSSSHHSPPPPYQNNASHILTIKNLSYNINKKSSFYCFFKQSKPTNILKSVSFSARSSEILAVVGPSGTGKSTLLRILSGRISDKDYDPKSVFLDDLAITNKAQLRKICGFVAQEDNLLPLLTVKETLMFNAKFRLKQANVRERKERVESLMIELGLVHVADSFVGDEENRGISGGEKKRVSIGVDLIHDPPILLVDEPTSGLDSTSALQMIELLSSMAKSKQRIVVISIHQPSYRIIQYISHFLILSGGSIAHNGSLESLEEDINGLGFEIPDQVNAIEFAMEILPKLEESYVKSSLSFDDENDESFLLVWQKKCNGTPQFSNNHIETSHVFRFNSLIFEIMVLCERFWKIIYRTKQLLLARTIQALVGGLGLGSVYVHVRNEEEGGVAERLGLFAFSLSFLLSSTVEALPIYLQERRVLMKEASRGAYKISSYMIANTIIFLPFLFVVAMLFSAPLYWIVGLNPSIPAFGFFTFLVWLIVLMASSLVLFLSAISPDFISGNSLICTVLGTFFLFSGYFIPKEVIPKYWLIMYYVSLYRYPLDCLLINEYWGFKSKCFSWSDEDHKECILTGADVLRSRGLDNDTRWINVGIMFGFFVLYRLLCWFILVRRVPKTTI